MKEIYQIPKEELIRNVDENSGLTSQSAREILAKNGENVLIEEAKKSILQVFLGQFSDLLVIILIVAAIISMVSGNLESSIVIIAVIFLNAILGTVEYVKASQSLSSLKALSSPKARVIRDGKKQEIASRGIVEGDVLLLEAGDMVAADGRILSNYSLRVNESSLTGESTSVDKRDEAIEGTVALADRINMVYSGSLVAYGRAKVLVTATGMNTEMGKIAGLMNSTKEKKTPLQISLDEFSKKLAIVIAIISVLIFGIRLWQDEPMMDSLMFAVALAVAAIPEALSSIVTIVQAIGTKRMADDNAIIKELKAVESLGCVSVICSDKTGTLTQNKMTVKEIYIDEETLQPEELNIRNSHYRYLLYNAILNNDAAISEGKDIGDPTESCLLTMASKAGLEEAGICEEVIRTMMPRISEIPFDSDRKLMSTVYKVHGVPTIFTKGALDVILNRTVNIHTKDGVRPITDEDKDKILAKNQLFSENGLRVLAFAYKEIVEEATNVDDESKITKEGNDKKGDYVFNIDSECNYTFSGIVSMIDPPREESVAAVADAISAGIKPVMITGDHKITATAIAKQIGIYRDGDMSVTGEELDSMSDIELMEKLDKISVYARVSPENKIRIVDAWQRKENVVAMTGDGVNDAPALKKADIGVAMGITGTEVSKDASAMILADDNFATIIKAVLNGRNVYRNILNAIQFLLSGNLAAIIVVLYCTFMALDTPFEPVHLLFINLLTDSLPALAIGMEASDKTLLKDKPRRVQSGILNKEFSMHLVLYGGLIAVSTVIAYHIGLVESARVASTMAFATLTLSRLFHGFNCRSKKPLSRIGLFSNKWSLAAFFIGVALLALVIFAPFMHGLFLVENLVVKQVVSIVILAFIPTFIIQIYKMITQRKS